MLEILLMQYESQFGKPFPLKQFEGQPEIDVINIIYDCLLHNDPDRRAPVPNRFPTAPGLVDPWGQS